MLRVVLLILPLVLGGEDLKTLLEATSKHSDLLKAKSAITKSKEYELESKKSTFYPTIDLGASYENSSNVSLMQTRDRYSVSATASLDLYDGGAKISAKDAALNLLRSSQKDESFFANSLSLEIAKLFFAIKSKDAKLDALRAKREAISKQLERLESFFDAGLASKDELLRLRSSYESTLYELELVLYERVELVKQLELKSGYEPKSFDESHFIKDATLEFEISDEISSLEHKSSATRLQAREIESIYYPRLSLQNRYSRFWYAPKREFSLPNMPEFKVDLEYQNTLMLNLNMRLFDFGSVSSSKKALLLNSQAMAYEREFKTKEQKQNYELAKDKIASTKRLIASSQSAYDAAESTFVLVSKKYEARLVDYVAYLDALSTKAEAEAMLSASKYELESAYALLYFYANKEIGEFLK